MTDNLRLAGAQSVPVVSLEDTHKVFGSVRALIEANLKIAAGECIGLVGHNGAGKSTLVNLINGRLSPTQGTISYKNCKSANNNLRNAKRAKNSGIRSVFQELSLCPNLTVLENYRISYKNMPRKNWRKVAHKKVLSTLDGIFPNHCIDPKSVVGGLTIAERQMVEIAIAFSEHDTRPSLVILDEPTSSLDASIAKKLLSRIKTFCKEGGAIIFISHIMGEIFDVATRIVVMKDGYVVADKPAVEFTKQGLVDAMGQMVAHSEDESTADAAYQTKKIGKEVVNLPNGLRACKYEIIGLAGLAGHGQTKTLTHFFMSQSSVWKPSPYPKVAFIAGDRVRDGIMPLWSILRNISLKTLFEFSSSMLVDKDKERNLALNWKNLVGIRTGNIDNPLLSLSGGNQQKALFARALASSAPIVVMDDPMRGVDIGTKKEVYKIIQEEAKKGRTFLWYSTEVEEILECDRVFVFRDGEISAELIEDNITEENILKASFALQEADE